MASNFFRRPAVFAATVAAAATLGVALAGAVGGAISSYFQQQTERSKFETETLLTLLKLNPTEREEYTKRLIQSGKLRDMDGAICMAFIGRGCPMTVVKANP